MNKKPIIGIIPTFNQNYPNEDPYLDIASFVRLYADKIAESGGIPVGLTTPNADIYTAICDGYLWPGGTKINYEYFSLLEDAILNKKPVLGICLGAQAISVYFNLLSDKLNHVDKTTQEVYDLYKIDNPYLKEVNNISKHKKYVTRNEESINKSKHEIEIISEDSFIYEIYQTKKLKMPSLHKQCINRVCDDLIITAKHEDVIEAIEYQKHNNKILGVQFHPELLEDKKIFAWLISNCNKE